MMKRLAGIGVALTLLVTVVLRLAAGPAAMLPAVLFGLLATGVQMVAVAVMRPVMGAPFSKMLQRWSIGMALRLGGVVLFAVAVAVNRTVFPPIPTAFGYLGVLLPLLFMEMRFLR